MRLSFCVYLIKKMEAGQMNVKICNSCNISDFNLYLRKKCDQCINGRINSYFRAYYSNPNENVPVF